MVLVTAALAASACAAPVRGRIEPGHGVGATVVVPPGGFEFVLPRTICDSAARIGDTVTTSVFRPVYNNIDKKGHLVALGATDRDTTIPSNLKAFLSVTRVGDEAHLYSFTVGFAVDSFGLDRLRGQVAVSALGVEHEAVDRGVLSRAKMVQCYSAHLTGGSTAALVLREK